MTPTIRLLVTDLDNTLYDWVGFFVPALYAMVDAAVPILDQSSERLLDELLIVNRLHKTTERPFALLDLPSVSRRFPTLNREERKRVLDPAFHAFNSVRKQTLRLYDGVFETLRVISQNGTAIVAHTDAHAENALFRLKKLGLQSLVQRLYAPQKKGASVISGADEYLHPLPEEDRKPNPRVLLDICAKHNISPTETLYVGDSLVRDVGMANAAGTFSALAWYGTRYSAENWRKLIRVTHWTKEDAERESEARLNIEKLVPDVTLASFSDLLTHFTFNKC